MESILPQGSVTLWVCKEVFRLLLSKVFDLFAFILYWYDIGSDILLAIKFKENCHPRYFIASIGIMCHSFVQSIYASGDYYTLSKMPASERKNFRKCRYCCSWAGAKRFYKGLLHGIFFPIHLIHLSLKLLVFGNEGMTEQEKLHLFAVKFSEGIMESFPQLMLSFYVILRHGLDEWVQVASIFGSSLSLLYCFSMKHAYLKNSHYPNKMEIFIAGLNNIIPMILLYVGQFVFITIVISWNNFSFGLPFYFWWVLCLVIGIISLLQYYGIKHQSFKKIGIIFTCSRVTLILFFVITVIHTEKTITYTSSVVANSTWLQHLEKNETNVTNAFLTPFKNCPNATLEEDFDPYQMNVVDENQELFMYLMWTLLVIGIAHVYFECRNDAKNGVKSTNLVDFIMNTRLVEALEEIEEQYQSDIV